jgi:hypothetical protein
MMSDADWHAFFALLDYLELNDPPTQSHIEALRSARQPDFLRMSKEQVLALEKGPCPQALSFLSRPDATAYVKSIANDLGAQVKIVSDQIADQLRFGESMAPGYSHRIGVILRKAKRKDLSDRFSTAYKKHDNPLP